MSHEHPPKPRDSAGIISASFTVILIALIFVGIISFTIGRIGSNALEDDPGWRALFDGVADIGIGVLTASSVLLIIEMTTIDRIVRQTKDEVEQVVASHHAKLHITLEERLRDDNVKLHDLLNQRLSGLQIREMGIIDHFAERKDAIPQILDSIDQARRVRILGVCHSLFWEAVDYDDAAEDEPDKSGLAPRLRLLIERDEAALLEIIYLSRSRLDLYRGRDDAERGGSGDDLLLDTRYSLNRYALPLYFEFAFSKWSEVEVSALSDPERYERMEKYLRQVRILESSLPPTIGLIITDETMFASPYLADNSCLSEPCTVYQRRARIKGAAVADDWDACWRHYERSRDESRRLFSDELVQQMARNMAQVRLLYDRDVGDDLPERNDLRADRDGPCEAFLQTLYAEFGLADPDRDDMGRLQLV